MINNNQNDNTTLPISEGSREVITKMKAHNLLSIGTGEGDSNNKDIYLLAIALGLENPTDKMSKPESWTRTVYFSGFEKSLVKAAYLGNIADSDDISDYCDIREAFAYCKMLTDEGFLEIDKFAQEALYDPELMVKKMLEYVDSIYDGIINVGD